MFFGNCPCCSCVDKYDDFVRSNSTNIGSDWTEEAGSWEIEGNALKTTSTDAVAVYGPAPDNDSFAVTFDIQFFLTSGTVRLYIRDDDDNYIVGEARFSGNVGDAGYIRLIQATSGVESVLAQVGFRNGRYWRMCVDADSGVVAFGSADSETGSTFTAAMAYVTPPGNEVALGTGDTLWSGGPHMKFYDFTIWKPSGSDCPPCTQCCDLWPREEIQLELTGLSNTTSGFDGCTSCTSLHGTYTLTLQGSGGMPRDWGLSLGQCALYVVELDASICGVRYICVNLGPNNANILISRNEWGEVQSDTEYSSASADYDSNFDGCSEDATITDFGRVYQNLCLWAATYNSSVVTIL